MNQNLVKLFNNPNKLNRVYRERKQEEGETLPNNKRLSLVKLSSY